MPEISIALFTGNYNHIKDGVSLTLNKLAEYLHQKNIPLKIFGPTVEQPAIDHIGDFYPVPSIPAPGRPEYRISTGFPKKARKVFEEFNPSLVHIATPDILGFKAMKTAQNRQIPVVASYHTHFTSYLKYYHLNILEGVVWKYLRWFYRQCRHVYVPSPSMQEGLARHNIREGVKIWARGVDTSRFAPQRCSIGWREKHGFKKNDCVVTFVSRLVWEKNLSVYINTIKKLQARYARVKALVVGDGPAMHEVRDLLPEAVYTGFLTGDELATAYASSDLFMFPSDTETFGNVTLEAMASGLPVLVADATGSRSLVENGTNGYALPANEVDQFVQKAMEIIRNEQLRQQMGEASRKMAGAYSWDIVNGKLLNYYRQAAGIQTAPAG